MFLFNLKLGIPYLNNPPNPLSFSKMVTWCPLRFNCCAAANPAGPEPIMATFLPVRVFGGRALIIPSINATSVTAASFSRIVTGASCNANTHDFSHGAGQIRPVKSGKLFVSCKFSTASFH